jgi:pimeloyl-ACP methyl ester carboxylesterase
MLGSQNAGLDFSANISRDSSVFGVNQLPDILGLAKGKLQQAAAIPDLFPQVFGAKANTSAFRTISQQWAAGNFTNLFPAVQVLSASDMNGAFGAFASSTKTAYLSDGSFKAGAAPTNSPFGAVGVLVGLAVNWLDDRVGGADTLGDEADWVRESVFNVPLSSTELSQIKARDNRGFIKINGQQVAVERDVTTGSTANTLQSAKNIGILGAASQVFTGSVSASATDSYLKLQVAASSEFKAVLNGLTRNVDIRLLDAKGTLIQGSFNTGTATDSISRTLVAGTYYLDIRRETKGEVVVALPGADVTRYSLNLSALPILLPFIPPATNPVVPGIPSIPPGGGLVVPATPFVRVTSPNGGNSVVRGGVANITWQDNIAENVRIDLYKGGIFYRNITTSTPSTGSFNWTIPTDIVPNSASGTPNWVSLGSDYEIRIRSVTNSAVIDSSDARFSITGKQSNDLFGSLFVLTQKTVKAGATVDYAYTVRNDGTDAVGASKVGLYLSSDAKSTAGDIFLGEINVGGLAAKTTSAVFKGTVTLPSQGNSFYKGDKSYFVKAVADYKNVIVETNEANNAGQTVGNDYGAIAVTGTLPLDTAGNTTTTARKLGVLNGLQQPLNEFVSPTNDPLDMFEFSLTEYSNFKVTFSGMTAPISVKLLDASQNIMKSFDLSTPESFEIFKNLGAGTYYLAVASKGADTSYTLTTRAYADVEKYIDFSQSTSSNEVHARTGWVGNMDVHDFIPFSIVKGGYVKLDLTGLTGNASLRLLYYPEGQYESVPLVNNGQYIDPAFVSKLIPVGASYNLGSQSESIYVNLDKVGKYFIHVYAETFQEQTPYTLQASFIPDDAGNTPQTARLLQIPLNSSLSVSDRVHNGDTQDYYQIALNGTSDVRFALQGKSADVNLKIFDQNLKFVQASYNTGLAEDVITLNKLAAGLYYALVYQEKLGTDTEYALQTSITGKAPVSSGGGTTIILQPPAVTPQWKIQYFSGNSPSGTPVYAETMGNPQNGNKLNFAFYWGENAPNSYMSKDNFSARVTGNSNLDAGEYRITVSSDDGIRVRASQQTIIDKWFDQGMSSVYTGTFITNGGNVPIEVDYYEKAGYAGLDFLLERIGNAPSTPISNPTPSPSNPISTPITTPTTLYRITEPVDEAKEWKASLFSWNRNSGSTPPANFYDGGSNNLNWIGTLNLGSNNAKGNVSGSAKLDWGTGTVKGNANLPSDGFAIRAYTWAEFDGGSYNFTVRGDDGYQILAKKQGTGEWFYITPKDQWQTQGYGIQSTFNSKLPAGRYDLHFHYFENGGEAKIDLSWNKGTASNPVSGGSTLSGTVITNINIRSSASATATSVGGLTANQSVTVDAWTYGGSYSAPNNTTSNLWYRISGTSNWIGGAYISGISTANLPQLSTTTNPTTPSGGTTSNPIGGSTPSQTIGSGTTGGSGVASGGGTGGSGVASGDPTIPVSAPTTLSITDVYDAFDKDRVLTFGGQISVQGSIKGLSNLKFYLGNTLLSGGITIDGQQFYGKLDVPKNIDAGSYVLTVKGANQSNGQITSSTSTISLDIGYTSQSENITAEGRTFNVKLKTTENLVPQLATISTERNIIRTSASNTWVIVHGFNDDPYFNKAKPNPPDGSNIFNLAKGIEEIIKGQWSGIKTLISPNDQVLVVDWSEGASEFELQYDVAASRVDDVGASVAKMITKAGINPKTVNFIGHSLGSYVSAYAAKALGGVNTLTLLDPATEFDRTDLRGFVNSKISKTIYAIDNAPRFDSDLVAAFSTQYSTTKTLGTEKTTARESYWVDFAGENAIADHGEAVRWFIDNLRRPVTEGTIASFDLLTNKSRKTKISLIENYNSRNGWEGTFIAEKRSDGWLTSRKELWSGKVDRSNLPS